MPDPLETPDVAELRRLLDAYRAASGFAPIVDAWYEVARAAHAALPCWTPPPNGTRWPRGSKPCGRCTSPAWSRSSARNAQPRNVTTRTPAHSWTAQSAATATTWATVLTATPTRRAASKASSTPAPPSARLGASDCARA